MKIKDKILRRMVSAALVFSVLLCFSGCDFTGCTNPKVTSWNSNLTESIVDINSFADTPDGVSSSNAVTSSEKDGVEQASSNSSSSKASPTQENTAQENPGSAHTLPQGGKNISLSDFTPITQDKYYCYNKLSNIQKKVYDTVCRLVEDYSDELVLIDGATQRDIAVAYNAVHIDNPRYFWMGSKFAVVTEEKGGKTRYGVSVNGNGYGFITESKSERDQKLAELNRKAKEVAESIITDNMNPYHYQLAIHNYICKSTEYNRDHSDSYGKDKYSWTVYGALVQGKAVCEGYSRVMQLLLDLLGVKNTLILGTGDGDGHVWNAVCYDSKWFYTDVTWDDGENGTDYKYFYNTKITFSDSRHKLYPLYADVKDESVFVSGMFNLFDEHISL